jgi:hypothetical protein
MTTATRATDPDGITIDRKIPLWGLLTAAAMVFGQGVLLWKGQDLQAAELRHQSEQIHEMASQIKTMAELLGKKDAIDVKQDLRIDELERRLLTMEQLRGAR